MKKERIKEFKVIKEMKNTKEIVLPDNIEEQIKKIQQEAKKKKTINRKDQHTDGVKTVLKKLLKERDEKIKNVEEYHVQIKPGNSKEGKYVYHLSILPIIDCPNCSKCQYNCYDIKNMAFYYNAMHDYRTTNSAIHKADPERFWNEAAEIINEEIIQELRLNNGGDLTEDDFRYVIKLAKKCKKTKILAFTKNYNAFNKVYEENGQKLPKNLKIIFSRWYEMECDNIYEMPESHVIWNNNKDNTAPQYGAILCQGDCSKCHFYGEGCWTLKHGQHVAFFAH